MRLMRSTICLWPQRDVFLVNRHVPQVEQQPQQQVVPALFWSISWKLGRRCLWQGPMVISSLILRKGGGKAGWSHACTQMFVYVYSAKLLSNTLNITKQTMCFHFFGCCTWNVCSLPICRCLSMLMATQTRQTRQQSSLVGHRCGVGVTANWQDQCWMLLYTQ